MFITKKKLEDLIQKRIMEKEREDYFYRRIGDLERELHQRVDYLCESVRRLERILDATDPDPKQDTACAPIGYMKGC